MVFVACGLNHKTAPLPMRERMARPLETQATLLQDLISHEAIHEAAMLSTCNRTEFYCEIEDSQLLVPWLAKQHRLSEQELSPFLYLYHGEAGVKHALRVASGLDSMMLGEPQILGQMKQAYQHATTLGTAKQSLRQVFQYIFSASKRVRNRSGIGNNPVSIAYAAVQLIGQCFKSYAPLKVFLIGSGETASLVARYLSKEGVREFLVASRTLDNAQQLAQGLNGRALSIGDIPEYLAEADVVISATACPLPFINQSLVRHALQKRQNQPMFFLDLAVPRDIEADVAELPHVHLFNIDDLQNRIDQGLQERQQAALQAEQLIEAELDQYIRWHRSLRAQDVIVSYREQMQKLAEQEMQIALARLQQGQAGQDVLTEFTDRLVNKLIHSPSVGFRQVAWEGQEELLDLARYLFNTANYRSKYEENA